MIDIDALWVEMAALTRPKCGGSGCRGVRDLPNRCCDSWYCDLAIETAAEVGVSYPPTGHPSLPLMGPDGCSAHPKHRPTCTLHTCAVNSLGEEPDDPAWNERYFALRERIARLYHELLR